MVACVGASFALQCVPRCCTKPRAVFGFCGFLSRFYLQIEGKREWTRGDSNPWPPPCEGGEGGPAVSCHVREYGAFTGVSVISGALVLCSVLLRSGPVAARLLHRCHSLHPHKVRDDRYSTSCLEANFASLALGKVCELLRPNGVLRSWKFLGTRGPPRALLGLGHAADEGGVLLAAGKDRPHVHARPRYRGKDETTQLRRFMLLLSASLLSACRARSVAGRARLGKRGRALYVRLTLLGARGASAQRLHHRVVVAPLELRLG